MMTPTTQTPPRRRGPLPKRGHDRLPPPTQYVGAVYCVVNDRGLSTEDERKAWRADYSANREKRLASQKAYRQRNPELVKWRSREQRRRRRARLDEQQAGGGA